MSSSDEFNVDKVVKGVGLVLIFGVLFAVRLCRVGLSDTMVELFDPRKMVTDYDCSTEEDCCDHCDFAFAFNDPNFSDRVLGIHILSALIESTPGIDHLLSFILRFSFFISFDIRHVLSII
ncbi:hypothetical protein Hdeb2414_s0006g00204081 [Helianthus debilis subsp. tardiflorus]